MLPVSDFPELRNLHLLKAMGVTVYHPRYRLPGAAASRVCQWPEVSAQATSALIPQTVRLEPTALVQGLPVARQLPNESHVAPEYPAGMPATGTVDSRPESAGSALQEVKQKLALAAEPVARQATAEVATSTTQTAGVAQAREIVEVPAFQALFCPVNHQLAVLVQMPALASVQLQEKDAVLLNNILRWLGVPALAPLAPHVFRWPLPGMQLKGQQDAGLGLHAFVDQASQEFGARQIVLFGQLLQQCLDAAGASGHGLQFSATYSISELQNVPQLKREAWQSLLPLYQRLRTGSAS